jgi:hypothetical protein
MYLHLWDHNDIEHEAQSMPDAGEFKREVIRRLYRVSKYPTSAQVRTVIDQVVAEMKPLPERPQRTRGTYVWK